jgi:hypothetical protein
MTSLHEPVIELVRAALDPAARKVRRRRDSPICQVVTRAAKADLKAGGMDDVTSLAIGTSVAAAGLTYWITLERQIDTTEFLDGVQRLQTSAGSPEEPTLKMLRALLTGKPGMTQAAELMVKLFREDEEGFYDLIVELGNYTADIIGMLASLGISDVDNTLNDLDDMLVDFYTR